jgi:hypothetical protein
VGCGEGILVYWCAVGVLNETVGKLCDCDGKFKMFGERGVDGHRKPLGGGEACGCLPGWNLDLVFGDEGWIHVQGMLLGCRVWG